MSTPQAQGQISQVVLAAAIAGSAEMGGTRLPLGGRTVATGVTAALGAIVALIVGRMVAKRSAKVFAGFGGKCPPTALGVPAVSASDLIVSSVLALVVASAVSGALSAYQRQSLLQGKLGVSAAVRGLTVAAAVGLSQYGALQLAPTFQTKVLCKK